MWKTESLWVQRLKLARIQNMSKMVYCHTESGLHNGNETLNIFGL